MAGGYEVGGGDREGREHFKLFQRTWLVSTEIFSFVWYVCSKIAYMRLISLPSTPIERKSRGKAVNSPDKRLDHKKFVYS